MYFVYSALEAELLIHRHHPIVSVVYFPQLDRQAYLAEDLAYYYGNNWRESIATSEVGRDYVAHLHEIAKTEPALLVAHSYVRYLGDLSAHKGRVLTNL